MATSITNRYSDWQWSEKYRRYYCALYDENNNVIEYQWEGGHRQSVRPSQPPLDPVQQQQQQSPQQETAQRASTGQPSSQSSAVNADVPRSYSEQEGQAWQGYQNVPTSTPNTTRARSYTTSRQPEETRRTTTDNTSQLASSLNSLSLTSKSQHSASPPQYSLPLQQVSEQASYQFPSAQSSNTPTHSPYDTSRNIQHVPSTSQMNYTQPSSLHTAGLESRTTITQSPYDTTYSIQRKSSSRPTYTAPSFSYPQAGQPYTAPVPHPYDNSGHSQTPTPLQPQPLSSERQAPFTEQPLHPPGNDAAILPENIQKSVGGNKQSRYIQTGEDGREYELLDTNYKRVTPRHHADFFRRGRVFKMLWTEPAGQPKPGESTRGSTHFSRVWLGEDVYSEIRRFVVVKNKNTFSQCIPIQTYRRKGAAKQGLIIDDHAIIYTGFTGDPVPPRLQGEERISKRPIRVVASNKESLDKESRINFGKPYAVEHNVKLVEIGMVAPEHQQYLDAYFRQANF